MRPRSRARRGGAASPSAARRPSRRRPAAAARRRATDHVKCPPIGPRTSNSSPGAQLLDEVRRHLAVVDALDGQLERVALGRRGDRVRALRLVAVLGGQPHVDVLAGAVPRPPGHVEHERARARRLGDDRRARVAVAPAAGGVSRPSSAARATGRRSCGSRPPPRSRARRSTVSVSPRTHFALFQKYRCGTSSRAGPPCSGSSGSPSYSYDDPRPAVGHVLERQVGRVAAVATTRSRTRPRSSTPSSSTSTDTPVHVVSSFDHFVTQWMSTVNVSVGSARNSSQVHERALVDGAVDREAPLVERACAASARRRAPGSRASGTGRAAAASVVRRAAGRGTRARSVAWFRDRTARSAGAPAHVRFDCAGGRRRLAGERVVLVAGGARGGSVPSSR